MSWRDFAIRKGTVIKTVNADGTGDYTTLSAALAAITDASATKRYVIMVLGDIAETSAITRKSYIDVIGLNARITVNSASAINAVNVADVVFSVWRDLEFHRAGAVTSSNLNAIYVSGTTDKTCRTYNCEFYNDIAVGTYAYHMGLRTADGAAPYFEGCGFYGGSSTGSSAHNNGARIDGDGIENGKYINCIFQAGGGTGGYGGEVMRNDSSHFDNCQFLGGSGTVANGLVIAHDPSSNATYGKNIFRGCKGIGGSGTTCNGVMVLDGKNPIIMDLYAKGGPGGHGLACQYAAQPYIQGLVAVSGGGTTIYGIYCAEASAPVIKDFLAISGVGTNCYGIRTSSQSRPMLENGIVTAPTIDANWNYTSADDGRFGPSDGATYPYQLNGMIVLVNVAQTGKTLSVGTAAGGTQIATGIDIGTTGYKSFAFTKSLIAAGGYMYATPSASITEGSVSIIYSMIYDGSAGYMIYHGSAAAAKYRNVHVIAPGSANALLLSSAAATGGVYGFENCNFESLLPASKYAAYSVDAETGELFQNCVFTGLKYNLTGFSGENGGVAASIADGGTIAHGLGAAPTIYSVLPSVAGEVVSATVDTTNITVAIKKVIDGSAGTTQSIAWTAKR